MSIASLPPTLRDVIEKLGSIPLERIPAVPAPGTATEADVLRRPGGEKRLYELVDGVLVEKPMGFYEARVAAVLLRLLDQWVTEHDLGVVAGADATLRLEPGLVRLPDVSFVSWDRLPNRELPIEQVPDLAPDLAIEVLSPGNTPAEMDRKLREYFAAGVRLVWYIDPERQTARVYWSVAETFELAEDGVLDGDDVLPGFQLQVRHLFELAGRRASS